MDTKKLNDYIEKEMAQIGKDMKREKERCARLYPDWRDDEFNMLDNYFIWGYCEDSKKTPSFYTWDDAYVYYNRIDKTYYMTLDTGFYDTVYSKETARIELGRLHQIKTAFRNFLLEIGESLSANIFPYTDPALEAYSLSELYLKLCIAIEGYEAYCHYLSFKGQF